MGSPESGESCPSMGALLPLGGLQPTRHHRREGGIRSGHTQYPRQCHGPPIITPHGETAPREHRADPTQSPSPQAVSQKTLPAGQHPTEGTRRPSPCIPRLTPASPRTPPPGQHCPDPRPWPGAQRRPRGAGLRPEGPAQPHRTRASLSAALAHSGLRPGLRQPCAASRRYAPVCPCGPSRRTRAGGPGCPTPRSGPPASAPLRSR